MPLLLGTLQCRKRLNPGSIAAIYFANFSRPYLDLHSESWMTVYQIKATVNAIEKKISNGLHFFADCINIHYVAL